MIVRAQDQIYDKKMKLKKKKKKKKVKRTVQGVLQSLAADLPRHQEEEEADKTKEVQIEQTYEKYKY